MRRRAPKGIGAYRARFFFKRGHGEGHIFSCDTFGGMTPLSPKLNFERLIPISALSAIVLVGGCKKDDELATDEVTPKLLE